MIVDYTEAPLAYAYQQVATPAYPCFTNILIISKLWKKLKVVFIHRSNKC